MIMESIIGEFRAMFRVFTGYLSIPTTVYIDHGHLTTFLVVHLV